MLHCYRNFHSQHGEDRALIEGIVDVVDSRIRIMPPVLPDHGVFVDVGASWPTEGNNTYHFEMNGWTGICIEPDERCIPKIRSERQCDVAQCAIVLKPGPVILNLAEDQGLSSLGEIPKTIGQATVEGRTLEDVLQEHGIGKIDLLSIDTEGSELDVWNSFTWEKHKPTIVIMEWYTVGKPSKSDDMVKLLTNKFPYKLWAICGGNLIFSLKE